MVNEALVILLSFLVGYLIDNSWATIQRKIPSKKHGYFKFIIKRMRIHHNWLGYVAIIWGFFAYPLILVSGGLGMIVGHKIRDNLFWFVENVEKDTGKLGKQIKEDKKAVRKKQIRLKRKIQRDMEELKKTFK